MTADEVMGLLALPWQLAYTGQAPVYTRPQDLHCTIGLFRGFEAGMKLSVQNHLAASAQSGVLGSHSEAAELFWRISRAHVVWPVSLVWTCKESIFSKFYRNNMICVDVIMLTWSVLWWVWNKDESWEVSGASEKQLILTQDVMCVCVCMCDHVCKWVHVCIHVCVYTCVHMGVLYICMHACACVLVCLCYFLTFTYVFYKLRRLRVAITDF